MAMIEAYRIGVELVLGGDLSAGIEALIPGLTRLDTGLSEANAEAKDLAASLVAVAATAAGIGQAADAMQRLNLAILSMNHAAEQARGGGRVPVVAVPPPVVGDAGAGATVRGGTKPPSPGKPVPDMLPETRNAASRPAAAEANPIRRPAALALAQVVEASAPVGGVEPAKAPDLPPRPPALVPPVTPAATALPLAAQQALVTARTEAAPMPSVPEPRSRGPLAARLDSIAAAPPPVEAPPALAARPMRSGPAAQLEQVLPTIAAPATANGAAVDQAPGKGSQVVRQSFAAIQRDVLPQMSSEPRPEQPRREIAETSAPLRDLRTRPAPPPPIEVASLRTPTAPPQPVSAVLQSVRPAPVPSPRTDDGWQSFRDSLKGAAQEPATRTLGELSQAAKDRPQDPPHGVPGGRAGDIVFARPAWQPGPDTRRPAANDGLRGLETAVRPASREAPPLQFYHPQGGQAGPVIQHVTYVQLDERTIARAVTRQQLRMMGGQVSGTLRPDPSIAPQYGAHLLET